MVVGTSKILMAWSMAFEAYFLVLVELTFHLVTLILGVNYMKKKLDILFIHVISILPLFSATTSSQ